MKHLVRVLVTVCFLFGLSAGPVSAGNVLSIKKGEPVHLASWFVISGPNSSLGIDEVRGIELAIEAKGGSFKGHPIKLSSMDDGCSPEGGQTAASKIAADPSVLIAIGPSCSSAAKAGVPILWKMKIPCLSPSASAPFLTDPATGPEFAGYLRVCQNDKFQSAVAAEFTFKKLGLKKAATIHDGSLYAQSLAQVFADVFTKLGGAITSLEAISPGDTDMRPVLTKIASGGPQMIYMPLFIPETAHCARQAKEISGLEKTALMGSEGSYSPDFLSAAGNSALGMYHSSPDFSAMADSYGAFLEKFKKKYGTAPEAPYHAHAYDSVFMIFKALEKVAVVKGDTLEIDRDAFNKVLHETKEMKGLTGTITCDKNGDCADPKIAIYKVTEENLKANKMSTVPFWKKY